MFLADSILNNQITISITVEQILSWVIIGLIAGLIASVFVRGRISLLRLLFIGLIGAVVGGFLFFDILDLQVTGEWTSGILIRWIDILVSVMGALLVIALTSTFRLGRL
jgi:uncharacterized membrane protein YeaQ/YmgE (transglycosylase-associated protein family)